MIIGLCGRIGSGKSSLANLLVYTGSYTRVSFADPLRAMLDKLMLYQGATPSEIQALFVNKELPNRFFNGVTTRYALQTLGTDWGRNFIHPDLWVDIFKRRIQSFPFTKDIICDDVRFQNEAEAIRDLGGKVIRIHREQISRNEHISEKEIDLIQEDARIVNDGTFDQMLERFWEIVE